MNKLSATVASLLVTCTLSCSDEDAADSPSALDLVPVCQAENRDYDAAPGRYPWAGDQRFYRLDADGFCSSTNQVLSEVDIASTLEGVKVIVSPHAGWQYSGFVTATVLSRTDVPDLVIIIGNNHKDNGEDFAVYPDGSWSIPTGDVPVDEEVAQLLTDGVPGLKGDKLAHSEEHSAEVQVVWLNRFNPNARIVPIAIDYTADLEELEELGTQIADQLATLDEDFLVIATTDMTHFEPVDVANTRDDLMLERILALDSQGLFDLVHPARGTYSMCGLEPTIVGMQIAKELGASGGEIVARRTSDEVNGDSSSVVGYAGIAYH